MKEAEAALQSAYDLIMVHAEKITDPTLRQSFLENAPINRQIIQANEIGSQARVGDGE